MQTKLNEQLEVSYYDFSDDMICVEVTHNGRELGAFCSHRSEFSEWSEEEVKRLAENHAKQYANYRTSTRKKLATGLEVEYYSHSDDMMCVSAYYGDREITSLCTDRYSFEEWLEDEALLEKIIASQT